MNNNYCDIQDNCEIVNQFKAELSKEKNKHNILKKMFADIDKANVGLHNELDQLKAEKERLQEEREKAKNYNYEYGQLLIKSTNENNKLKRILTEIKEIAEEKAKVNDWLALEILQKISEVEE